MKNILSILSFIILSLCGAFAQSDIGIPSNLPFGKLSRVTALSQVEQFDATAYTIETDENGDQYQKDLQNIRVKVESFDHTDQLAEQIMVKNFDFKVDPRKMIFVRASLNNKNGVHLFESYTSFNLDIIRNEEGVAMFYQLPENACDLYFWMVRYEVTISGLEIVSAEAVSNDEVYELELSPNGFWIDGFFSYNDQWHTLRVRYANGFVAEYDRVGQRVIKKNIRPMIANVSIADFVNLEVYNQKVQHWDCQPEYDKDMVLQVRNQKAGVVTLDICANRNRWHRPAYLWITTMEDYKAGRGCYTPVYSPTSWGETQTINYHFEANTTYLIVPEWRGDTDIDPWSQQNFGVGEKG